MKRKPKIITQKRLVKLFKDIKRLNSDENRFCFLIGAGASKSSGIQTGWELSEQWYKDLVNDLEEEDLKKWENEINFDKENVGVFYPQLYRKRYEASPQIGYEEFKKLMENIEPGIGYVILSQILANEKHNFVITTNFDYLIEDAVRMYTATKPFSAGHETLAEFISSQTERPTIIKVHRDLFLHPFNNVAETQKLKDEWKKALIPILKNFNLLVIGYGGNDGSLMDYLNGIKPDERKAIYWCVRNRNSINDKINNLLGDKDFIVEIKGFDDLMISLNEVLGYKIFEDLDNPENHPFVLSAKNRITDLNNKIKALLDNKDIEKDTKDLFTGALKYIFEALIEIDNNKKEEIYNRGLKEFNTDIDLLNSYANFLNTVKKDYDKSEKYYLKAIEVNPKYEKALGNYANFLNTIKKDYVKAEEYYLKAIKENPKYEKALGNYALFLDSIKKDYDKAEEFYLKAIEANPKYENALGNYALFLDDIKKDYDKAEEYYLKAINVNPKNEKTLGNYALLLDDVRKDYDKAEEYYLKAIEANPKYENALGNYAIFLNTIKKDYDKAEDYYLKAIEVNPKYEKALGNYALFLKNIKKDYDKAEEYYLKAIETNPKYENALVNYALFLNDIKKDYAKAEEYYLKAIEVNPKSENSHLNLGFLYLQRGNLDLAEKHTKKSVKLGSSDFGNMNLGHIYFAKGNKKKALETYNLSIENFESREKFFEGFDDDFEYIKQYGITEKEYIEMKNRIKDKK